MNIDLEEIKINLRLDIDYTIEDMHIQSLAIAAEEYLTNAGVAVTETSELYKLAVKILVTHWYDNREPVGKADKLAYSLEAIIMQLRYIYPVVTV